MNGHRVPLCGVCVERLESPDHPYVRRCLERRFPEGAPPIYGKQSPPDPHDNSVAPAPRDKQPSLRSELAAAVRHVNAELARLPESRRPDLAPVIGLEGEVRAADEADDRERGLAAIRAWRGYALATIAESAEGAS